MVSAVGFAIGIDLGGTKLRGGLVAADGTVAVVEEQATDTSDAKAIVDQIVAMPASSARVAMSPVWASASPGRCNGPTGRSSRP